MGFVRVLLDVGIVEQDALRSVLVVRQSSRHATDDGQIEIVAGPVSRHTLVVSYELDYGPGSPITPQRLTFEASPENFVSSLAFARTFILEKEAAALKAEGYGSRVTEKDLLIFGAAGVVILPCSVVTFRGTFGPIVPDTTITMRSVGRSWRQMQVDLPFKGRVELLP